MVAIDGNMIWRERRTPDTDRLFRQEVDREIQISIEAVTVLAAQAQKQT